MMNAEKIETLIERVDEVDYVRVRDWQGDWQDDAIATKRKIIEAIRRFYAEHATASPEAEPFDCHFSDIRKTVVNEQADFEEGSSEWCCYASLLDVLEEKYGRSKSL